MSVYTIKHEVNSRINSPLMIDVKGKRYVTENGELSFPAPELWVLEKNLFFLLNESKEIELKLKYHMRPSYLSYDEYGTVILSDALMYINGIRCLEEFVGDRVLVPSKYSIIKVCQDNYLISSKANKIVEW